MSCHRRLTVYLRYWFPWLPLIALALCASATIGCGNGHVKTYPVTVELSFPDGSTVEGAVVAFQSIPDPSINNGEKPISAIGKIGSDGTCRLTTHAAGDGAVAGRHRVTIGPPLHVSMASGTSKRRNQLIHPRYRNPDTSGIEATVTPGGKNNFAIEILRPR